MVDAQLMCNGFNEGGDEKRACGDEEVRIALLERFALSGIEMSASDAHEGGEEEKERLGVGGDAYADSGDIWIRSEACQLIGIRRGSEGNRGGSS